MHLAALVIGERVLLEALGDEIVGNHYGQVVAPGVGHQLQDVKQLARIAAAETQQGVGLLHGNLLLA